MPNELISEAEPNYKEEYYRLIDENRYLNFEYEQLKTTIVEMCRERFIGKAIKRGDI